MTKTIFLVDDDDAIRHSASFMLRHAGYTVKTYPDGVSFLDAYEPNDSACILLDVRMPVMDGLTVQQALSERGNKMPIIVLTGHGDVSVAVQAMKNGAIVANSGHFNVEIDIPYLESMASGKRQIRPSVEEYAIKDGRKMYLLGEGRLINLAAAEGHPSSVMDMSFANQALCIEYLAGLKSALNQDVHPVPDEIDNTVAKLKLSSLGIGIDTLTEEQKKYLESWEEGT